MSTLCMRCLLLVTALTWLLPASVLGQSQLVNSNLIIFGHINTCTTGPTGTTGNAYACTLANAITAYYPNACYAFVADVANSASATINLHSIGAKIITKMTGGATTALAANDIRAGARVQVCYDQANDRMQCASGCTGNVAVGGVTTDTAQRAAFYDTTTTVKGASALTFSATGDTINTRADRITAISATATLGTSDGPTVACTGGASDVTLSLPAGATTTQRKWTIVKVDSGAGKCLVKGNGTETINGSTGTLAAAVQRQRVDVDLDQTTGTPNWSGTTGKAAWDLTADVTGILPIANAGSGLTSGTNGQVLMGNTAAAPTVRTLTTMSAKTAAYTVVTADFAAYTTFTVASGTPFTLTLPATAPGAGLYITVLNYSAGALTIGRNTRTINGGTADIVLPAAGTLTPTVAMLFSDGTNYVASETGTTQLIASGTKALQTGAIASAACATESTVTATGAATTDVVTLTFASDPTAVTGYVPSANGMLTIIPWLTTNTLNLKTCNNTASSITPGAISVNWRIAR